MDNSDEIKLWREDTRNNFRGFCRLFLKEHFNLKPAGFHQELFDDCQNPLILTEAIVAPRYHAKSTIFSFGLPIWAACYEKYKNILLISATLALAEDWVRKIKREFEENSLLIAAFGDLRSDKWASNEIRVAGTNIIARGRGQQVRGYHYDLVIADDLEDDELVRSEVMMAQFEDWFDRALYNTIDDKAKLFYIGTILSESCFLKKLLKKEGWARRYYQAYREGIEKEGYELWPEKWPHESLQRKKLNNSFAFALEFMNDPQRAHERKFREEWFQYYDSLPQNLRVTVTIDPAVSVKKQSDRSAIVTCGTDEFGNIYILDVVNELLEPKDLYARVMTIYKLYAPFKVGVEVVAAQKLFKPYMEEAAQRGGIHLRLEEIKTERSMSKEERIFLNLSPYFSNGKIWLKRGQFDLINQLRSFPNGVHDDIIDALAYQIGIILKAFKEVVKTPEQLAKEREIARIKEIFTPDKAETTYSRTGYRAGVTVGE